MERLKFVLLAPILFLMACEKASIDNRIDLPYGKWKSAAFFDGASWQGIITPHYFEIQEDHSYRFRDHNGILCTGMITGTEINGKVQIEFQNSDCGLTKRVVENIANDTLELSVLAPPNITNDRVKYSREN